MTPKLRLMVVSILVAVGIVSGALGLVLSSASSVAAAPPAQRGGTSPCDCGITKTLEASNIRICDATTVTLALRPECPGTPIDIVMIIDEVYKPGYSEPKDRTNALRTAITRLALDKHPLTRVGVVWMQDGTARKRLDLTNDARKVISNLDVPPVSRFAAPTQCFDCGYREAVRMLDKGRRDYPDSEIFEVTILAPLGVYSSAAAPGVISGSNMVKARQARSITTCFAWTHCDPVLRRAASEPRLYLGYGEGNRLAALLSDVVRESVETFLRAVTVTEFVPDGVRVLPDSIDPPPDSVDDTAHDMVWAFPEPIEAVYTITYRVAPDALGAWPMGRRSWAEFHDSHSRVFTETIPAPMLEVAEECPQDTPVPPPTATSTPRPTLTDVPTATAPPTLTPTPRPAAIYLPIALREACSPDTIFADVALVLDMSTSMRQPAGDGRPKLDAVLAAAHAFVDGMSLEPNQNGESNRIAVVGFNKTAWIGQKLTNDGAALGAAVDALPAGMVEFTRLDLAFERGLEALELGSGDTRNLPVMIVLTDGMPDQVPFAEDGTVETTVLRSAQEAKDAGVTVYTIGVGRADGPRPEINPELLKEAASAPGDYYASPDAEDLAGVYAQLNHVIPCGGSKYWPKTP